MKRVFTIFVAMCILLTSVIPASAECNEELTNIDSGAYYISYDKEGNVLSYNMPISLESPQAEDHTYLSSTLVDQGYVKYQGIGYHPNTSVWRRVASYSFSDSKTVDMSISMSIGGKTYGGVIGVSASETTSFGYSIDVDQNRDSKLYVYVDYYWKVYRGDVCDEFTHEVLYSFNYLSTVRDGEKFIPVYR